MSTIVVQAFITLDGVVQSGGGPDEDREGGFKHGGWALEYDEQMDNLGEIGEIVGEWESRTEALLLGRRTGGCFRIRSGMGPSESSPGPPSSAIDSCPPRIPPMTRPSRTTGANGGREPTSRLAVRSNSPGGNTGAVRSATRLWTMWKRSTSTT